MNELSQQSMKLRRDIFRFKQFSVANNRSAMKVGTDGVLLGAWTLIGHDVKRVWDAGAGTGLLSLMIAQRYENVSIDAIEIDAAAAMECRENVAGSPWSDRIRTIEGDLMDVWRSLERPGVIISNPPFFSNGLKAPDKARTVARHADGGNMGPVALISLAGKVLNEGGSLCMITPADIEEEVIFATTMARLSPAKITEVASKSGKAPTRLLWQLTKGNVTTERTRMILRGEDSEMSDEFKKLTEEFYLDIKR